MPNEVFGFGLLRRRQVILPSLWGCVVLMVVLIVAGYSFVKGIYHFLSPNRPIGGEVLVVEGWIPDYSQREALAIFRSGGYRLLITTGGPVPPGLAYSHYGNHAAFASATLQEMGLGADSVVAVPSEWVPRDRTFMEGVALKEWMRKSGSTFRTFDLFTFSAHGRRSRYLYRKALGNEVRFGVYSAEDAGYEPSTWWQSSNGVRKILDETFAYIYAVILFNP